MGVVSQVPENPFIAVSRQGAAIKVIPENPFLAVSSQGAATKVIPENPFKPVSTQVAATKPEKVSTKDAAQPIPSSSPNNVTKNINYEKIKKDSIGIIKTDEKIKKDSMGHNQRKNQKRFN